jgi:hypothetical protein
MNHTATLVNLLNIQYFTVSRMSIVLASNTKAAVKARIESA